MNDATERAPRALQTFDLTPTDRAMLGEDVRAGITVPLMLAARHNAPVAAAAAAIVAVAGLHVGHLDESQRRQRAAVRRDFLEILSDYSRRAGARRPRSVR